MAFKKLQFAKLMVLNLWDSPALVDCVLIINSAQKVPENELDYQTNTDEQNPILSNLVVGSGSSRSSNGGGLVFAPSVLVVNYANCPSCLYLCNAPTAVTTVPTMRQSAQTVVNACLTSC